MTLFTFLGNILTDPIGFSKVYFQKSRTQPLLSAQARSLYFMSNTLAVLLSIIVTVAVPLHYYGTDMTSPIAWILLFVMLPFFIFILLFTNFVITKWFFRTSITTAGFTVTKKEADALSLYLMAHMQALFLFWIIGCILTLAIIFLAAFLIGLDVSRIAILLTSFTLPILSIRRYYAHYRLVQQWSDASPMESIFTYLLLRLFSGIILSFVLIILAVMFSSTMAMLTFVNGDLL